MHKIRVLRHQRRISRAVCMTVCRADNCIIPLRYKGGEYVSPAELLMDELDKLVSIRNQEKTTVVASTDDSAEVE